MRTIPVRALEEGMVLAQDVFSVEGSVAPIVRKGTILSVPMILHFRDHGIEKVDIRDAAPPFELPPPPKPIIDEALRDEALVNLEELFNAVRGEDERHMTTAIQRVKQIDSVVDQLVASLTGDRAALINIADLKSYDEYTYHHSLSVAVLSIAIGQKLGFDIRQLNRIGKCAIMHDIGKTAVPVEIINKPTRLNDREFALIKTHSSEGYQYLVEHKIEEDEIWRGVLCHHEKMDGTGYPLGLKDGDIPLYSRIISIADVYDALTSYRPYRSPMPPADAVEYLMGGVGVSFDYDMVGAFLKKLELYPVGSFAELSDSRMAVVIDNENALRPIVRVLEDGIVLDLYRDRACLAITIKRLQDVPMLGT